jgi:hypothetical protein
MCIKATDFVELNEREDFKTSPSSEWSLRHIAFPWFIWPKATRQMPVDLRWLRQIDNPGALHADGYRRETVKGRRH